EYAADRGSAGLTGAPEYLMSALQKISGQMAMIPQRDLREVQAMNAFFIVPASVKAATAELLMDHPPLEKRIAALAEIAREMGRPVGPYGRPLRARAAEGPGGGGSVRALDRSRDAGHRARPPLRG